MKYTQNTLTIVILALNLMACNVQKNDLKTVPQVDINRYCGTWYEIARFPHSFEKKLECVSATYTMRPDGKINVTNRGVLKTDHSKKKEISGTARVADPKYPGRLKVTFFWPFAGDYYIVALDPDYRYALIGAPSRKYLWLLSKDKELSAEIYEKLVTIAQSNGFDTDALERVLQRCE